MKSTLYLTAAFALLAAAWGTGQLPSSKGATPYSSASTAADSNCYDKYLNGKAPQLPAKQAKGAVILCYSAYASQSSPITKTPIWSAEALTPATIRIAGDTERVSEFHPEDQLKRNARAELSDYRRSGWDRGHLAPSADMPGLEAQEQSFSLANIVPQSASLNRGPWADLEADVRSLARRRDAVYVVTGGLYEGQTMKFTPSGRVAVPSAMWKAIASPGGGAIVFTASNDEKPYWKSQTIREFSAETGIDPFPGIADQDASTKLSVGSR